MLRVLFRAEVNLILSALMFFGGVTLSVGRALGVVAAEEPALIYHMSAFAITATGYGNILVSLSRQENANSASPSRGQGAS